MTPSPSLDPRRISTAFSLGSKNDSSTNFSQPKSSHARQPSQDYLAVNIPSCPPSPLQLPVYHPSPYSPYSLSADNVPSDASPLRRKPATPISPYASAEPVPGQASPHVSPFLLPVDNRLNSPLMPPPSISTLDGVGRGVHAGSNSREGSRSRPATPASMGAATSGSESMPGSPKQKKHQRGRSWFSKSGSPPRDSGHKEDPPAWIAGHFENVSYNLDPLINGEKVTELWREDGDTFVYLFPRASGKEASFRIDSTLLANSQNLTNLCINIGTQPQMVQSPESSHANLQRLEDMAQNMSINDLRSRTSDLRMTGTESDRNSTASLRLARDFEGGFDQPALRELYLPLAFEGDVSAQSTYTGEDQERLVSYRNFFAFLSGERLVATRRQKTPFRIFWSLCKILERFNFSNLDGTTLGEVPMERIAEYIKMFKFYDVRASPEKVIEALVLGEQLKFSPLYNSAFVHAVGDLELVTALNSPRFDLLSESTRNELERASFDLSKRVQSTSIRLRDLEFHSLWTGLAKSTSDKDYKSLDLKAWRTSFSAFRSHVVSFYSSRYKSWPPKGGFNRLNLTEIYNDFSALYDLLVDRDARTTRSSDPRASQKVSADDPSPLAHKALRQILAEYDSSVAPLQPPIPFDVPLMPQVEHRSHLHKKRLTSNEISNSLVTTSYNKDNMVAVATNEFVEAFTKFERKTDGHIENLLSARMGQWILLYAVIQSLPLLVVDAPGVEATDGVSYFLSVAPKSTTTTGATQQSGIEQIFRRSHCWQKAKEWGMVVESAPVLAPPPRFTPAPKTRRVERPVSRHNFDDILRGGVGTAKP